MNSLIRCVTKSFLKSSILNQAKRFKAVAVQPRRELAFVLAQKNYHSSSLIMLHRTRSNIKIEIEKPAQFPVHNECRSSVPNKLNSYAINLKTNRIIFRSYVPEDKVSWSVDYPEYSPVEYTASKLLSDKRPPWADPVDSKEIHHWNQMDHNVDRRSFMGKYEVIDGLPRNSVGRTGIKAETIFYKGRGVLGRWGPNHAADPVVTRWKLDTENNKVIHPDSKRPILQFAAIKRVDTNSWAIPGGMCDPGEKISQTLKREFMEEALDALKLTENQKLNIETRLKSLFDDGQEIYRGYVDDPRNTDNAWMETIVYNFHDEDNTHFDELPLSAGDDAGSVKWLDIDSTLNLYANHKSFIEQVAKLHEAHW